jgi:hypothetical protein
MAMPAAARRKFEILREVDRIIYIGKDSGIAQTGSMPWLEIRG